jgi:ketosteroid isomerase-like protein
MTNLQTIKALYSAVEAREVETVLGFLSGDVTWRHNSNLDELPWHRPQTGIDGLRAFFKEHHAETEHSALVPESFAEGKGVVVVRVRTAYVLKRNGARIDSQEVHWWGFAGDGKIKSLLIFEDSAAFNAAFEGARS